MTVHFIGAGPGAADLITLRGRDLLAACPVCLHAGSTVSADLLAHCPPDATIIDTAPLDLDRIVAHCAEAHACGRDVARLHSGDLAAYSAVGEQCDRLARLGIPTALVPGVSALGAASAALGLELTRPGLVQSVVVTRLDGRASKVPESESLEAFAATGATLAIHLASTRIAEIASRLAPILGADCPVAIVASASRADERIVRGTLDDIALRADPPPERLALVLVGRALGPDDRPRESRLYAADYPRRDRPAAAG